jgi:ABC-type transport system involved in multi-copper enzyme maturation permease subunit
LYIRAGYLAALILVLLWSLLAPGSSGAMSYSQLAQAGATSFAYVAYLQIGLICVLAPVFMAGAIAQEASPRTWEVLLTTPLSALQIVLGNLSGRLFFILGLLVSSLPLFALTQYFGGVPGRSIFISYAIAGSAALLVGSIAIALSVSRLVGKRAVFAFYVAVVSYLAVTIAVDAWLRASAKGVGAGGKGVTWMTAINPFLGLRSLLNPSEYPAAEANTFSGMKGWFLESPVSTWCFGSILLSLLLVVLSTITVRLGGLGTLTGASERGGIPWYRKMLGFGKAGSEYRAPRAVWHNPIAWREAASRNSTFGRIVARWSFVGAGVLWGLLLVALYHTKNLTPSEFKLALLATILGELAVITLVAMNMAATAVSREREDGTLDLLLTTPITPGSYLKGKMRGLIAYLIPMLAVPVATLAIAGLYVLTDGLGAMPVAFKKTVVATTIMEPLVLPEAGLLAPLVIIPFMAFCVMVGLNWSLKSKGTLSAVVGTVAVAGIVAGVVGLCGFKAGSEMNIAGPALAAISPASLFFALVEPGDAMSDTISSQGGSMDGARIALFVGAAVLGAPIYIAVVYGIHAHMVRNFDMTVRKLAGVK